ncbi:hypothetical protein PLEOSDRAFT_1059171 [Pleurotus ostreatus PC15]|uniref:RING-CH-type domain-containing protein n=1 Tax=Pleurotus ostreatus (strain PC15) TaxID=1137138 RepID=A0A067N7J1_PLEO1|nr:hypothetical protein PLEOSDRAFT_1059171 [Pleurotus ostreatus PC15]
MSSTLKYPTVNDLKVRTCYVCREEERHTERPNPPKAWVHPCNCTLVAHEACLLQWIRTAQSDSARAKNALKCPQCGTQYELQSEKSIFLRVFTSVNGTMQFMGRMFTVFTMAGIVAVFGTGIYIVSTAYGAYALKEFIGNEMFNLLLTEEPANWPWHAFINLPLIPLSLILSRTSITSHILPVISILLTWPTSSPVPQQERSLREHWTDPRHAQELRISHLPSAATWPPSPLLFGLFVVPVTKIIYKRYFTMLTHWVLGSRPPPGDRQFVWQRNEGNILNIRIVAGIRREGDANADNEEAADNGNAEEEPQDVAAAAERTLNHTTSSLGRFIGGALLIPAISSFMGNMLFRLSKRSYLLRQFLAVKPPLRGHVASPPLGPYSYNQNWAGLGTLRQAKLALRLVFGSVWGGTRTWADSDPVWWRNAVGLGLFVVAKDCIQLCHLWMTKRELESRHVKDRSFEGIDIKELDLI